MSMRLGQICATRLPAGLAAVRVWWQRRQAAEATVPLSHEAGAVRREVVVQKRRLGWCRGRGHTRSAYPTATGRE